MPNHCASRLTITGNPSLVLECLKKIKSHDEVMDLNAFDPMPEELRQTTASGGGTTDIDKKMEKRYGNSNWYDWASENWGTKWGVYETALVSSTGGDAVIRYQTAWAPLLPRVLEKLSDMFPSLTLTEDYAEAGGAFAGTRVYHRGKTIEEEQVNVKEGDFKAVDEDGNEVKDGEDCWTTEWQGDERYTELFDNSG